MALYTGGTGTSSSGVEMVEQGPVRARFIAGCGSGLVGSWRLLILAISTTQALLAEGEWSVGEDTVGEIPEEGLTA